MKNIQKEELTLTDEEIQYLLASETYNGKMQISILAKVYRIENILEDRVLIEDQIKRVKELVQK